MEDKNNKKSKLTAKQFLLITLGWPLIMPFGILVIVFILMFIGIGWLFVFMMFFMSISSIVLGIGSIVAIFLNLANSTGGILILLGVSLMAFGILKPLLSISIEFFKGFLTLSKEVKYKITESINDWRKRHEKSKNE